jgi:hypothetical protein
VSEGKCLRALALIASATLLAGCNGGTVDRHALTNDSGKTTAIFAREQAAALRVQSSNLADALRTRPALASLEQKVRAKSRDAAKVSAALQRLHDHPSDRDVAVSVEGRLNQLGRCE